MNDASRFVQSDGKTKIGHRSFVGYNGNKKHILHAMLNESVDVSWK
jgi:hypothetical protein